MKVKIAYTVEVPDWMRREINAWYGRPGLASREEVKHWFITYGDSQSDDLAVASDQRDQR